MGRKKIALTPEQVEIVRNAAGLGLRLDDIAYLLGVSPSAFDSIKARDSKLKEAYEAGKVRAYQAVASTLYQKAMAGDTVCMIFYLKSQAGWNDQPKQEAPVATNTVQFYLPDNGRDSANQTPTR